MTTLRVARLRNRYHLAAEDRDARTRLDRVVARALGADGELDAALHHAGVRDDEEVCVRRVAVVARLGAEGEAAQATAWSLAVARAVARALRDGRDVVRYGSRHGAMREVVRRATRGDLTRAWAWRQLGLWTLGDAPSPRQTAAEVVAMLAREPHAALALLGESAAAGTLGALVSQAPTAAWTTLAETVARALGVPNGVVDVVRDDRGDERLVDDARDETWRGDVLGRAVAAALSSVAGDDVRPLATALAALTVLRADPARATPERARRRIAQLAQSFVRARSAANGGAERATRSTSVDRRDARAPDDAVAHPADDRARGITNAAGVLFLLHLVRALDLPAAIAASEALGTRPTRWTLHRLAADLLALRDDDPAALAFAGLAPDAPAPDGPPPTTAERTALDELAHALVDALGTRMTGHQLADAVLLDRVCRRRGEVVADPAWIEVRLPLDDVDLLVRRAGLDVDPDWCPWIGAVVRFRYV